MTKQSLHPVAVYRTWGHPLPYCDANTQHRSRSWGGLLWVRYCRQQKRSGRHSTSRPHYVVKCMSSLQWSADHERGLAREANRDTSATLGTTTCKDLTAVLCCHTSTKSVHIDTTAATWLIGTLHSFTPEILVDRSLGNDKYTKNQLIFVTPGGNG